MVIEKTSAGERSYDLYSRLMKDRIIMLNGQVNEMQSEIIVAQLLFLQSEDPKADITMFINSPGGVITAGMAMYDTMQYITCDVSTIVMGQACSMGSFLAQSGAKGKRFMLPHARHMVHQPSGGASGMASDIEISYNEIMAMKKMLTDLYVKHNTAKKTFKQFEKVMDRDTFMSAEESLSWGLCDKILYEQDSK